MIKYVSRSVSSGVPTYTYSEFTIERPDTTVQRWEEREEEKERGREEEREGGRKRGRERKGRKRDREGGRKREGG